MRRVGHIIEEIVEPSNMEASFRQVLRGRKRKRSRQGCYLLAHKPEVLEELTAQIASGTFRVKDYREREIVEGGKLRRIQVIPMKDRIAVHAIMAVVDRHLRKRFIRTTSASIKKRGMHDLLAYIRRDMREDPEGTRYCYKFDITKFYESVKQDFVMYCVNRVFKDFKLMAMLESFVRLMPDGLSIGLRSSRLLLLDFTSCIFRANFCLMRLRRRTWSAPKVTYPRKSMPSSRGNTRSFSFTSRPTR